MSIFFNSTPIFVKSWQDPLFIKGADYDERKHKRDEGGKFSHTERRNSRIPNHPGPKRPKSWDSMDEKEQRKWTKKAEQARVKLNSPIHLTPSQVKFRPVQVKRSGKNGKDVVFSVGGKPLPKHVTLDPDALKKMSGGLSQIHINPKKGKVLFVALNSAGNKVEVRSAESSDAARSSKFDRSWKLKSKMDKILPKIKKDAKSGMEDAQVLWLIQHTGARPGNDDSRDRKTGKTYGATTLEARHVKMTSNGMQLIFTGKSNKLNKLNIEDPELQKIIRQRIKGKAPNELIFPNVNDAAARKYASDNFGFYSKDFRTVRATTLAEEFVKDIPPPVNESSRKKKLKQLFKKVADIMGHGAAICGKEYIDPRVYSHWKAK